MELHKYIEFGKKLPKQILFVSLLALTCLTACGENKAEPVHNNPIQNVIKPPFNKSFVTIAPAEPTPIEKPQFRSKN